MQHPYPLTHFQATANEVVLFVKTLQAHIAAGKRHILIKAPVKSGKRIMVEVIALLLGAPVRYVTSLNRKDVKSQQAELATYGVVTHVMDRKEKVEPAIGDIRDYAGRSGSVICCFDECDYGSGDKQVIAPLFQTFLDDSRVVKVYFSATAHETSFSLLSKRPEQDYVELQYTPPATYRGAAFFLTNDLVFDPHPFFERIGETLSVSQHGIRVVCDSITTSRHIGIVRVAERACPMALFKNDVQRRALEEQLAAAVPGGKRWEIKPIDEQTPFDWEHRPTRLGYVADEEANYLFVVKQTCGRGTDLKGWHPRMAFWHDARPAPKANLNTTIQAFLRPSHYSVGPGYNPDGEPIRLYVDRRVVQVAVDDDMDKYLRAGGKAPARTRVLRRQPWLLSEETFSTVAEARAWAYQKQANVSERCLDENDCYPYRGAGGKAGRRRIDTLEKTKDLEHGDGVKDAARIIPFRNGAGGVSYIVAYSIKGKDDDASSVSSDSSSSMTLETTKKSMYNKKK